MTFVDTGAWFAMFIPADSKHVIAKEWLANHVDPLVTTDYIVDELLTLLKFRGHHARALEIGRLFFDGKICKIIYVTSGDIRLAWETFARFDDKNWSFTDCVSRVVMGRLGIEAAFAFDEHFRQFGTIAVFP